MHLARSHPRFVARIPGIVASLLIMLVALAGRTFGQTPAASLIARDSGGFGRLEFRFPEPLTFNARLAGSVLIVEFDRVVPVNPEKLPMSLPAYLAAARLDPDQRSMRFALTQPVRIDVKEAAERVFVDLLPAAWTGAPPPMPADVVRDLARRAREAKAAIRAAEARTAAPVRHAVSARLAQREDMQRMVFESPEAGAVQLSQNGADLRLRFPTTAALEANRLRAALAEIANDIHVEETLDGPLLMLTLREERQASGQSEDGVFVVDLPAAQPTKAPVVMVSPAAPEDDGPKPSPQVRDAAAPEAVSVEQRADAAREPAAAPAATVPHAGLPSAAPATAEGAAVQVALSAEGNRINLVVTPRVPAAVFRRGDEVWLVLQGARSVTLPPAGSAARALVKGLVAEERTRATLLRIMPAVAGQVSIAADAGSWTLSLGPDVATVAEPIRLRRVAGTDGRRILRGALPKAGTIVWIDDTETGERVAVGTMAGEPHAMLAPQAFAEAQFLPTALGLAVAARADDLVVSSDLDGFSVQRDGGLALSPDLRAEAGERVAHEPVIDAEVWAADRRGSVRDTGRALLRAAADAPKRDRMEARLRYARYLLANGLGAEAGGVLTLTGTDDPAAGQGRVATLLRAVAAIQSGDRTEAGKLLAQPVLALDAEGGLWRAYLDTLHRRYGPALTGFRQSLDVLERYPDTLQALLRPALVQTALEGGDTYLASQHVGELERLDAGARDAGLIQLLQGRIAEASGRTGEALSAYGQAAKSPVRPIEAEARLNQALLRLKTQPAERDKALGELETVAMIWRRGEIEVRARAKLSEIYAGQARWHDAFAMTKRAVEIQPELPLTRKLQDDTARRFEALFLDGQDDKLSQVEALAIFNEFRSLIPPGARGDEIVRRLAERLYELDLLDQATELLAHQVEHRLKGVARSQVAARLAVVHLVNGKPQEALKVLKATRLNALPGELRRARVLLEARTLAELSRTELAIEVLAAETGPDVERLRADISWRGKRWREAGEAYERALGGRQNGEQPLDAAERSDAVRAAVAYALAGDRLGLDRFRTKFLAKMSDSPDAETFRLVTLDSLSRPDAFRETARTVVSAQTLGDFLDAYRKRYPDAAGGRREAKG